MGLHDPTLSCLNVNSPPEGDSSAHLPRAALATPLVRSNPSYQQHQNNDLWFMDGSLNGSDRWRDGVDPAIGSIGELEAGEVQPSSTLAHGAVRFYHSLLLPIPDAMAQGGMHALGHSDSNQDRIITGGPTFDAKDGCNDSPDGHLGGVSPVDELEDKPPAVNRPLPSDIDLDELTELACLEDIKSTAAFIQALQAASPLDDGHNGLGKDTVERLRNPPTPPADAKPNFRLGLDTLLAHLNSSQDTHAMTRAAVLHRHPGDDLPSCDRMKCRIAEVTGIVPVIHHACPKSCLAFTGASQKLPTRFYSPVCIMSMLCSARVCKPGMPCKMLCLHRNRFWGSPPRMVLVWLI